MVIKKGVIKNVNVQSSKSVINHSLEANTLQQSYHKYTGKVTQNFTADPIFISSPLLQV